MRLPSAPSHVDHAAHDERLLDILEHDLLPQHPEFLDWAIVVMFYAALHYTKAALATTRPSLPLIAAITSGAEGWWRAPTSCSTGPSKPGTGSSTGRRTLWALCNNSRCTECSSRPSRSLACSACAHPDRGSDPRGTMLGTTASLGGIGMERIGHYIGGKHVPGAA